MPGNLSPIFSKIGKIGFASTITLANTAKDGTGTVDVVFTADATNGSFLQKLKIRPKGANVASVLRIFLNTGGVTTTAANNTLLDEISLPATALTEVAAIAGFEYPVNLALPAGYRAFVTLGTAVAGGYAVTGIGGDY